MRRAIMGIVGRGGIIEPEVEAIAFDLGRQAIEAGFRIVTGGLDGVMGAASRGARSGARYREGDTIGMLPGSDRDAANPWVDIAIPTGLSMARNILVVATSDVLVAVGGGAGTLTEIAAAWQLGRPIVALGQAGWAGRLAGEAIDDRRPDNIVGANDAAEAIARALELTSTSSGAP